MKIPVYASTGAFVTRKNNRNYRLIGPVGEKMLADGFEFLMFDSWNDEIGEIRKYLKSTGHRFPVLHMDKSIGEILSEKGREGETESTRLFMRDLETALAIGAETMVLHLWNGRHSDAHFEDSLPIAQKFNELSKSAGLTLAIENVIPKTELSVDRLLAMSEFDDTLHFTYDTKMAHLKNENPLLKTEKYLPLLTNRKIVHFHMNDSDPNLFYDGRLQVLHMGEGTVDFEDIFALFKKTAFSGTVTVESTSVERDGTPQTEKMNKTLVAIRQAVNRDR